MKQFIRPEFTLLKEERDKTYGKFMVEPLERGFGITLGNAIRRCLLTATPGAAVFAIRIAGAPHEFSSVPGIVEHVSRIILNIKKLVLRVDPKVYPEDEVVELTVKTDVAGEVTAGDLVLPAGVEIINPDLLIATVSDGGVLDLTLFARNSRGYKTFRDNKKERAEAGIIPIDANYSPIVKCAYKVDTTKIGRSVDLEKLEIEVTTDGSVTSVEAISTAARVLTAHLELFVDLYQEIKELEVIGVVDEEEKELDKSIEELEFTQRSLNCLKRQGINTLRELVSYSEDQIQEIRNLGRKSFKEIKDRVFQLGLNFKQA